MTSINAFSFTGQLPLVTKTQSLANLSNEKALEEDMYSCYGLGGRLPTQFAVCYNKNTLTPVFSGHIVRPNIGGGGGGGGRDSDRRQDTGKLYIKRIFLRLLLISRKPQNIVDKFINQN